MSLSGSREWRTRLGLASLFLMALVPRVAEASERTLRVEYTAEAVCPDARAFVDLAKQRVRAWPETAESADLVAYADVRRDDGVFVGTLALKDASGTSLGTREIREGNCDDVALALALFLAVAVEADAEAARARRPEPSPAVAGPVAKERAAKPPRAVREPPSWFVVADAHAVTGRTPNVAAGVSIALELRAKRRAVVVPFGGLGIDVAPYSTDSAGRGHVEFGWGAAFARMCAAIDGAHDAAGRWEPWACARGELGGLRAASHGFDTNRSEVLAWFAAGLEAGLGYWMTPMAGLALTGGASLPIVRHGFALNDTPLYRAPWLAAELGLGIKIRAW